MARAAASRRTCSMKPKPSSLRHVDVGDDDIDAGILRQHFQAVHAVLGLHDVVSRRWSAPASACPAWCGSHRPSGSSYAFRVSCEPQRWPDPDRMSFPKSLGAGDDVRGRRPGRRSRLAAGSNCRQSAQTRWTPAGVDSAPAAGCTAACRSCLQASGRLQVEDCGAAQSWAVRRSCLAYRHGRPPLALDWAVRIPASRLRWAPAARPQRQRCAAPQRRSGRCGRGRAARGATLPPGCGGLAAMRSSAASSPRT